MRGDLHMPYTEMLASRRRLTGDEKMATDVVMPQMGESIFEGTVTKWLKKPGESVERDEPLFEISTDKVDAEIPSPVAGMLQEIKAEAGATVQVNTVVAVIGEINGLKSAASSEPQASVAPKDPEQTSGDAEMEVVMPQMGESIFEGTITKWLKKTGDRVERDEPLFEISTDKVDAEIPAPTSGILREIRTESGATVQVNTTVAIIAQSAVGPVMQPAKNAPASVNGKPAVVPSAPTNPSLAPSPNQDRVRSSPLVRKIAKEHELDLAKVVGTGSAGRVTKEDVLGHLEKASVAVEPQKTATPIPAAPALAPAKAAPALAGQVVPMTKMRSIIAQRMAESKRTNAHVHTIFKIDLTRIVRLREKEKSKYEQRNGVKLTYMPFIARAVTSTLRKMRSVTFSALLERLPMLLSGLAVRN